MCASGALVRGRMAATDNTIWMTPLAVLYVLRIRKGEWTIDVHPRHGPTGLRHVHLTWNGREYSWNEDGTRHDAHRFPTDETKGSERPCDWQLRHSGFP
jgi:hypothetical protein